MSSAVAQRQRGAIALVILGLLGTIGAAGWLHSVQLDRRTEFVRNRSDQIARELQQAKSALISYAVSYADNYQPGGAGVGHFPCPDLDSVDDGNPHNDGPDPPCGRSVRQLGRLPRQTFTFASPLQSVSAPRERKRVTFHAHKSARDQQPWYAVSAAFINNPVSTIVNPATEGTLRVDQQQDVVAIVFAPGVALPGQHNRRPGDQVKAYLEEENADGDDEFTRMYRANMNDTLVYITRGELLPLIEQRVLGFVRRWLHEYQTRNCPETLQCFPFAGADLKCVAGKHGGDLPFLAGNCGTALADDEVLDDVSLHRHWFIRNQWHRFIRYDIDPVCLAARAQLCRVNTEPGTARESVFSQISVTPAVAE